MASSSVLECLIIHRPRSDSRIASAPRTPVSPVCALLGGRRAEILPEFRGLKIARRFPKVRSELGARNATVVRRRSVVCETQGMGTEVPDVTKTTWQSLVMECDSPVMVEFWAPWCGPCRMIHPVVAKLLQVYAGKMKGFKLNTDESPDIATEYGIRSIPTIMIFKNGEKKDAVIGAVPESTLSTCIEKYI